ncbi:Acetyltransferase-like protein 5 [Elsinoe fawcettii]|nr:Acetyltransferase-like protein 5 [Elsinoe fawcettii]
MPHDDQASRQAYLGVPTERMKCVQLGPSIQSTGHQRHYSYRPIASRPFEPQALYRERGNMRSSKPFLAYCDPQLRQDRLECKAATEMFNQACRPSFGTSQTECQRILQSVFLPALRSNSKEGPPFSGSIGQHVFVNAPFNCDYGYNIHVMDNVVIGADCKFQDAGRIVIGRSSIIGDDVRLITTHHPVYSPARDGLMSLAFAQPITVGERCFVGIGATILPGCKIGDGSIVGAGSVITKDVPEHCVVAGNPARIIKRLPVPLPAETARKPEFYRGYELASLMLRHNQ